MLRLSEVVAAIELELAVGERPFGHFDHTANRLVGPALGRGKGKLPPQEGSSRVHEETSHSQRRISFEAHVDPATGAVTYKKRILDTK